jgi:GT2 family glycosyltransferase
VIAATNDVAETLTVAIPTYRREKVLIDTIEDLLALAPIPLEILIVDQTEQHDTSTEARLAELDARGAIRWLRLEEPSIPQAMNRALVEARGTVVLFLDDDIVPEPGLFAEHLRAHAEFADCVVAGRVIQPWQEGVDFSGDTNFHFASTRAQSIREFMGGNFSLRRASALAVGGFDENFVKVAYRFEAEFAFRWLNAGHAIRFEPNASIHHLKANEGGTRVAGDHLRTIRPDHAVGEYYYIVRTKRGLDRIAQFFTRPLRSVATKFHLSHPWRIPATIIAELRAAFWALRLALRGPRFANSTKHRI